MRFWLGVRDTECSKNAAIVALGCLASLILAQCLFPYWPSFNVFVCEQLNLYVEGIETSRQINTDLDTPLNI